MRKKIEWEIEELDAKFSRIKVIGGWLIVSKSSKGDAIAFLSDRDHEWVIWKRQAEEKKIEEKF